MGLLQGSEPSCRLSGNTGSLCFSLCHFSSPPGSFFCLVVVSIPYVGLGLMATKQVPWATLSVSFWLLSSQLPAPLLAAFLFKLGAESSCLAKFRLQVMGSPGTAHTCLVRHFFLLQPAMFRRGQWKIWLPGSIWGPPTSPKVCMHAC